MLRSVWVLKNFAQNKKIKIKYWIILESYFIYIFNSVDNALDFNDLKNKTIENVKNNDINSKQSR